MIKEKAYIEIDASSWLDEKGITTSVWIGEGACEPCYEITQSYEEAVDQELFAHTIGGKLIVSRGHDNIASAEKFVHALEWAAVYARKRFEELKDV